MSDFIDIFQETSCPSMEVLDHYLSQNLSSGEQQKIEAHLVDCPLCNDAIEGLSMVQDKKALRSRIKRIKQLNEQRLFTVVEKRRETLSKRQSRVKPMKIAEILVAAAASIAILLATVFVIWQVRKSTPQQFAENQTNNRDNPTLAPSIPLDSNTTESFAEAILGADTIVEEEVATNLLADVVEEDIETSEVRKRKATSSKVRKPSLAQETTNSPPKPQTYIKEEKPTNTDRQLAINDIERVDNEAVSPVDSTLFADEFLGKEPTKLPVEREDISLRVEEKHTEDAASNTAQNNAMMLQENKTQRRMPISADDDVNQSKKYGKQTRYEVLNQLMEEGKSYLRQERFQEAKSRFQEVLQSDLKNTEAKLYLGIAQYQLGLFKEAQKILKQIDKDEIFGEEAKWQLVKVYTKLDKQERSKKLLEEIISLKGKYAKEAQELLDSLDE